MSDTVSVHGLKFPKTSVSEQDEWRCSAWKRNAFINWSFSFSYRAFGLGFTLHGVACFLVYFSTLAPCMQVSGNIECSRNTLFTIND